MNLVTELVAGATHSGSGWVSALEHEALDDAVEDYAVIKALASDGCTGAGVFPLFGSGRETFEVLHGLGSVKTKQVDLDGAVVGVQCCY